MAGAALGPLTVLGGEPKGTPKKLKVGLVGCGYRGNGALKQHVEAGKTLGVAVEAVAVADWFRDKALRTGKAHGVPGDRCFDGAKGYRNVIDAGPDIVLLATPPLFRPLHFEACVKAEKHVFLEKPVAVDPPGCRRVLYWGEKARTKGLAVVAGTNLRHEKRRVDARHAVVQEGALGELFGGRVGFCMGHTHSRDPIKPKTADELIASWNNWLELSGDHIVDVACHMLDLANWFVGHPPVSALGFGGRQRRRAGNMYDFFSIDYDYGEGVHLHTLTRQIDGCWNWVGLDLAYEKGRTDTLLDLATRKPLVPRKSPWPDDLPAVRSSLMQEQIRLLYHVLRGEPRNEAEGVALATATAILGRTAAYAGRRMWWRDMIPNVGADRFPGFYGLTVRPTAEDFENQPDKIRIPKDDQYPLPGSDPRPPRPPEEPKEGDEPKKDEPKGDR